VRLNPLGPLGTLADTMQSIGIDLMTVIWALCAVAATIMALGIFTQLFAPGHGSKAGVDHKYDPEFEEYAKKRYKKELYERAYSARHYGEEGGHGGRKE
jgi:hypothetical protein